MQHCTVTRPSVIDYRAPRMAMRGRSNCGIVELSYLNLCVTRWTPSNREAYYIFDSSTERSVRHVTSLQGA